MESSKLKNIVLIILVLTNVLLILLLVGQRLERRRSQEQALADVVELLDDRGIAVDPDLLPRAEFAPLLEVERDAAWERQVFTDLLGEDTALTQRGLVSSYAGTLGQAEVRGDGAFTVTFATGAYPLNGAEPAAHSVAILGRLGCSARVVAQEGSTVSLLECWDRGDGGAVPIYSCALTLTYQDGALLSIQGRRLVGRPSQSGAQEEILSLPTLLTRFLSGIVESGEACSVILRADQGYLLSAGAGGALRLTPVLQVVTDAGTYHINALTGGVSRS